MIAERRLDSREQVTVTVPLFDKQGGFLFPCKVLDSSQNGVRIELFKEAALPQYFFLSMMPDGGARRLCSRIWQLGRVAGVRYAER
jgi:hypothetical protein